VAGGVEVGDGRERHVLREEVGKRRALGPRGGDGVFFFFFFSLSRQRYN
jgi:hypothetical protein